MSPIEPTVGGANPSEPTLSAPAATGSPLDAPEGVSTLPMAELGSTGLKRSGGLVLEEYLPQLRGTQGHKVYEEMGTEPLIGGVLLAMREVVARLPWAFIPPPNPSPEEVEQARFVTECWEDMSQPWDTTLSGIMSMIQYGWSYHEVVYKYRRGASENPQEHSRFNDGRIGWRGFAIRSQDTLMRWEMDDTGRTLGMWQRDQYGKRPPVLLPMNRCLLFRTDETKDNPEGRSMLRGAYRPWWYKKRIEEIEAVGVERDLAGLPFAYVPPEWFGGATVHPNLAIVKRALIDTRRNEADGIVLPSIFDEQNNRLLEFKLLSTGGTRQFNTNEIVARYNTAVATSMLMDFMTMGHEGVGSYALGAAKISMWQLVIEAIAKSIAAVINQHAVPRLMRANGWTPDRMPELTYGDVATADLTVLGQFLQQMVTAGILLPDAALENYIRELLNLPSAAEGEGAQLMEQDVPQPEPADPALSDPVGDAPATEPVDPSAEQDPDAAAA